MNHKEQFHHARDLQLCFNYLRHLKFADQLRHVGQMDAPRNTTLYYTSNATQQDVKILQLETPTNTMMHRIAPSAQKMEIDSPHPYIANDDFP